MFDKPIDEAPRVELEGDPAPEADASEFRIRCSHAADGTFAGWLDLSGPGNWVYLSGTESAPAGMTFADYYYGGERFLNPVGTYVGNPRYLGANGNAGETQAAWNYWSRASAIKWDGHSLIQLGADPKLHLIDYGKGWVYWSASMDTALNFARAS